MPDLQNATATTTIATCTRSLHDNWCFDVPTRKKQVKKWVLANDVFVVVLPVAR